MLLANLLDAADGFPPSTDGQVMVFTCRAAGRGMVPFPKIIFVNGLRSDGEQHRHAAVLLSYALRRSVTGVFNHNRQLDPGDSLVAGAAPKAFTDSSDRQIARGMASLVGGPLAAVELELADSATARALVQLLTRDEFTSARIIAHRQGNIAVCAALRALDYLLQHSDPQMASANLAVSASPAPLDPSVITPSMPGLPARGLRIYGVSSPVARWPVGAEVRLYSGHDDVFARLLDVGLRFDTADLEALPLIRELRGDLGLS